MHFLIKFSSYLWKIIVMLSRHNLKWQLLFPATWLVLFYDEGFWFVLFSRVPFNWLSDTHPSEHKGNSHLPPCLCFISLFLSLLDHFPSNPERLCSHHIILLAMLFFSRLLFFCLRLSYFTSLFTPTFISSVKHGLQFPCSSVFT